MTTPNQMSIPAGLGSHTNAYTLLAVVRGHIGPVTCLSATDDGKLASGGADGVRLWYFRNAKQLQRPSGAGQRGVTTTITWIKREDEPDDGLVYGTSNGYLACWKEVRREGRPREAFEETYCAQVAIPGEITGIAFEASSNRLAVCNRNSVVQVFLTDSRMELLPVFSVVIGDHVPKAIAFGQMGGEHRDILTFGLYDGQINTLRGGDGAVQHTRKAGCMIANAAINSRRGVFCVDDPLQGVALYRLDTGARVRTYPVMVKKSMRPRQVTFAEDCSIIVSGSDHGIVYIFNRRSGDVVDMLKVGNNRVQAVTAMEVNGHPIVFMAVSRGDSEESDIIVWQKKVLKPKAQHANEILRPTWNGLRTAVHVCMLAASIAFIVQNLEANIVIMQRITEVLRLV